jgi:hypothetical protein
METARHIRILQLTYAAQLADAVHQLARAGVLEQVTSERRATRRAAGAAQAAQLGITAPAEAFTTSAELFGCADWTVTGDGDQALVASARHCLLCGMAKKAGAPSPCSLYCLDPIEAMVEGVAPGAGFEVDETLFDGERCRVRVSPPRR